MRTLKSNGPHGHCLSSVPGGSTAWRLATFSSAASTLRPAVCPRMHVGWDGLGMALPRLRGSHILLQRNTPSRGATVADPCRSAWISMIPIMQVDMKTYLASLGTGYTKKRHSPGSLDHLLGRTVQVLWCMARGPHLLRHLPSTEGPPKAFPMSSSLRPSSRMDFVGDC